MTDLQESLDCTTQAHTPEFPKWISVKDKSPEWDIPVLWVDKQGAIWIEDLDDDGNSWHMQDNDSIELFGDKTPTHWMPLPNPPKP